MAITNGYTTLAAIKTRLDIPDLADDTTIENVVNGVSRWIDAYTRRHFYTATETRYYTPLNPWCVHVDDLVSVTTLKTDLGDRSFGTTWATTDYDLMPLNANTDGKPYTHIGTTPRGSYRFYPQYTKSVQIVGSFGVSASSPWIEVVREACLIQCIRIFKRKDAPFGIAGSAAVGQLEVLNELDPDVKAMLKPPIRRLLN